jgi:cobalt-zinc-cadmium efflux system outer membrane protein
MTPIQRAFAGALVVAVAFTGHSIAAQTRVDRTASYIDPVSGLTIDEIAVLALDHSKRIEAARERVNAARGDRVQADLRVNPRADFAEREQAAGADRRTEASFVWPLDLFRRPARRALADRGVDLAEQEVAAAEWELAADVRRAAARVLVAARLLDVTTQQARAARELRDLAAASADAGAVARVDRDIAEVELRTLDAAVFQRRAEVDAGLSTLKGLAGLDLDAPVAFKRSLDDETTAAIAAVISLEGRGSLGVAVDSRPDVRALVAKAAVAAAEGERQRQSGRWDIDVTAGYMRTAMSFPQTGLGADGKPAPIAGRFHELSLGVTLALPWFNRNQGAVVAAAATARAALRERDALTLEAQAELRSATERRAGAERAVSIYRDGLLELSRHNLDVIQQTYQAGRATLNDVILGRRRQLELEADYARLLFDLYSADLDVRRALGVIR